jgi:nucleotide-binding universal stress UspA family protein
MFKKIAVAFDESPEADRALHSALSLAKLASSQLYIITVIEGFPAYMGYVSAVAPEAARVMKEERRTFYHDLQDRAKAAAEEVGLALRTELVEGDEVEALLSAINRIEPDLLVVGLRQDAGGLSRYLGGTAHRLAQHARCDVLGVR